MAEQSGDPAEAFEDLRAEVAVMRKAVEALPAAIRDHRPIDYAEDFAVLGKGLDDLSAQLAALQRAPALVMSPEQHGQSIARASAHLLSDAAQHLHDASRAADRQSAHLGVLIGEASTQDQHLRHLVWAAGAAFAIGLILAPFIAARLPFGWPAHIAALILQKDRWSAGAGLMAAANPPAWTRLNADLQLIADNREAVDACRAALAKSGRVQRCVVALASPAAERGTAPVAPPSPDSLSSAPAPPMRP